MKVIDLVKSLDLKIFTSEIGLNKHISGGYVSDLLSDVMGNACEGNSWITLQNHLNVIAIASLKDLACVILVKGIQPSQEVIDKANTEGIALLGSSEQTFELAGKIYQMVHAEQLN
ncbi:MAG: DRTGG domain-containing protein [Prolixibacteraceae bacterium]